MESDLSSSAARLSRGGRRDQLLDTAASLVVDKGIAAFTMEGLAARAGVSKALPYKHFDNADAVLVELYQREMQTLAERVLVSLRTVEGLDERVRNVVRSYFDAVRDRSALLTVLSAPESPIPAAADGARRDGVQFVTRLLTDAFELEEEHARARAAIVLGVFTGAVDAWGHSDATRSVLEDAVAMLLRTIVSEHPDGSTSA